MRQLSPFETIQNPAVGGMAIWAFVRKYCELDPTGVPILFTLPILPMVFHQETIAAIAHRRFDSGSLMIALREDRTISRQLQERTHAMMPETFRAIFLACSSGLIQTDTTKCRLLPKRRELPTQLRHDCQDIIAAARRLGVWFASTEKDLLLSQLDVAI